MTLTATLLTVLLFAQGLTLPTHAAGNDVGDSELAAAATAAAATNTEGATAEVDVLLLCEVNTPLENVTKMDDIWTKIIGIVTHNREAERVQYYTVGKDPWDPTRTFLREVERGHEGMNQHKADATGIADAEKSIGAPPILKLLSPASEVAKLKLPAITKHPASFTRPGAPLLNPAPFTVDSVWMADPGCFDKVALSFAQRGKSQPKTFAFSWAHTADGAVYMDQVFADYAAFEDHGDLLSQLLSCGKPQKIWFMGPEEAIRQVGYYPYCKAEGVKCGFYAVDDRSISCSDDSKRCRTPAGPLSSGTITV